MLTRTQLLPIACVFSLLLLYAIPVFAHESPYAYEISGGPRVSHTTNAVLTYLEGGFGALVMVGCGVISLTLLAFGGGEGSKEKRSRKWNNYYAAGLFMMFAVATFIMRSLVSTFFNDT